VNFVSVVFSPRKRDKLLIVSDWWFFVPFMFCSHICSQSTEAEARRKQDAIDLLLKIENDKLRAIQYEQDQLVENQQLMRYWDEISALVGEWIVVFMLLCYFAIFLVNWLVYCQSGLDNCLFVTFERCDELCDV
jgi:hypothetical protein